MKLRLLTTMILMTVSLCTGCRTADSQNEVPAPETETTDETGQAAEETPVEEVPAPEEAPPADVKETQQFVVDVTDNLIAQNNIIIGNAAAVHGYCGIMEFHLDDALAKTALEEIKVGHTYLFTIPPMMTMSLPPQVTLLEYEEASERDIQAAEEIRAQVSGFKDAMIAYESMSLEQIIDDANFSYALWTQEEIREYQKFLAEKGYTEGSTPISYVKVREELSGSVPGGAMNGSTPLETMP